MFKKIQIVLFIALCGFGIFYGIYQYKEIRRNHEFSLGEISDVEFTSKSTDLFVLYSFKVHDKTFRAKSSISNVSLDEIKFMRLLLVGKKLTVAFQPDNPDNSNMLFHRAQYSEFKTKLPDHDTLIINKIDSLTKNY